MDGGEDPAVFFHGAQLAKMARCDKAEQTNLTAINCGWPIDS
jgi:hypothetical protein